GLPLMMTLLEPSSTPVPGVVVASFWRAAASPPDSTSELPCTTTPGAGSCACAAPAIAQMTQTTQTRGKALCKVIRRERQGWNRRGGRGSLRPMQDSFVAYE